MTTLFSRRHALGLTAAAMMTPPLQAAGKRVSQPEAELETYRANLALLRSHFPNRYALPQIDFYLFGCGRGRSSSIAMADWWIRPL